jgi:hypothetical protein
MTNVKRNQEREKKMMSVSTSTEKEKKQILTKKKIQEHNTHIHFANIQYVLNRCFFFVFVLIKANI